MPAKVALPYDHIEIVKYYSWFNSCRHMVMVSGHWELAGYPL
jgi:hypothetical protein